ncbi:hypothetical protein [Nonomuraea bangladeshensis]|uniref:hypothetical protein n=1 Tax=Nonomuraea bangladeshensis TaxID=404385 RepID=UPI0031CF8B4D
MRERATDLGPVQGGVEHGAAFTARAGDHQVFGLLGPALTDYAVRPVRWREPVSSSG